MFTQTPPPHDVDGPARRRPRGARGVLAAPSLAAGRLTDATELRALERRLRSLTMSADVAADKPRRALPSAAAFATAYHDDGHLSPAYGGADAALAFARRVIADAEHAAFRAFEDAADHVAEIFTRADVPAPRPPSAAGPPDYAQVPRPVEASELPARALVPRPVEPADRSDCVPVVQRVEPADPPAPAPVAQRVEPAPAPALAAPPLALVPEPPSVAPEPSTARTVRARATEPAAEREYEGDVTMDIWRFETLSELAAFHSVLASIEGVRDVCIRTLDEHVAGFALQVAEPTAVIAELQARAPEALFIRDAAPCSARLEIFRDL
jgi:hypothetical protein